MNQGNVDIISFELTGLETDSQIEEVAWRIFCEAHPADAYRADQNRFWTYFHERAPNVTRAQMTALLEECFALSSPNDSTEQKHQQKNAS